MTFTYELFLKVFFALIFWSIVRYLQNVLFKKVKGKKLVQNNISKEQVMKMVEQTVAIIGDKWSLLIIGQLTFVKSPSRFNELMKELKPISSRTLSIKLSKLADRGIVEKTVGARVEQASSPYTLYTITEKGKDLVNALKAMGEWSFKWLFPKSGQNCNKNNVK